jgi:signal transduction histidine kinase
MSEISQAPPAQRPVRAGGRVLAEAVIVVAVTAVLMWAVWAAVDWSPLARHDPARTLLLGPRMAVGAMHRHEIAVFGPDELIWFSVIGAMSAAFGVVGLCWGGQLYRPGWLAVGASWLWLVGGLRRSSVPVLFTVGGVLTYVSFAVVAWIVLGFPNGRLRTREARWCVAGIGVLATAGEACEWLFFDPRAAAADHSVTSSSTNLLLIGDHPALEDAVQLSVGALMVVLSGVFLALLVQRWRSGLLTYHVSFAPVVVAALVTVPAAAWIILTTGVLGTGFGRTPSWGLHIGAVAVVIVIAAGVEIGRRQFGVALAGSVTVAMLGCFALAGVVYFVFPEMRLPAVRYLVPSGIVAAIGGSHLYYRYLQHRQIRIVHQTTGTDGLDIAVQGLRDVTGDSTLELWRWDPVARGYVVGTDERTSTPGGYTDAVVRELTRDEIRLGALRYDKNILPSQPELLTSTQAIATSLLERERALLDLGESRRRIAAAGDEQRRRIERDLHDGAQNHLTFVMYLIQSAGRTDDPHQDTFLREAADHLAQALNQLRDLTHGIYPTELTQGGLRPAFTSLAERSAVPVTITGVDARRLPVEVEAAAYFITAEAVTNANKHSAATGIEIRVDYPADTVRIVVSDNGRGGAQPTGGGLRGVCDRAEALSGRITVNSPPSAGTVITVTLPIDERQSE